MSDRALASNLDQQTQSEIARLNKIIKSLMDRAERSANVQASDFGLFQTAILLEEKVRSRTEELEAALRRNETINRALREAEQKYRGIFDDAIVGIFQTSANDRFLCVNSAMTRIFGFETPEAMIAGVTDISRQLFLDPMRHNEFVQGMDRLGSIQSMECQVIRQNGCKIWIALSGRVIRENSTIVRYEGMCEDITERKQLRVQLLQAQKLKSVGQLAAGIAHEINTPTQYIGDNVRFLKASFQDLRTLMEAYDELLSAAKIDALSSELRQRSRSPMPPICLRRFPGPSNRLLKV